MKRIAVVSATYRYLPAEESTSETGSWWGTRAKARGTVPT